MANLQYNTQGGDRYLARADIETMGGQRIGAATIRPGLDAEANARLWAEAPALLDQLIAVLARLDLEAREQGEDAVFILAGQRDSIRAAIARASITELQAQADLAANVSDSSYAQIAKGRADQAAGGV